MKRTAKFSLVILMTMTANIFASDAETSASAAGSRDRRNGAASATAHYTGDLGFARTETSSGDISRARGVAVGLDEDGLTFSLSNAFATRDGSGLATNFNISIDRDGRISRNGGIARADSPYVRSVSASGAARIERRGAVTTSYASGHTDPYGRVEARTYADSARSNRSAEYRVATFGRPSVAPPDREIAAGCRVMRTETVRRVENSKVIRVSPTEIVRYTRVPR